MNIEELKQRYPLIAKKHKRTDLNPIYDVEIYISQESRNKREVTAREIWKEKNYPKRVIDNAVKWLFELEKRIKRKKIGSGFFFCEEKKDGTFGESYYTRDSIDNVKSERAKEVLEFLKNKPTSLLKEIKGYYSKLKSSITKEPHMNSYNKIVEFLWEKGYSRFVKLNFKSSAYRYRK